jgi:hypothetical protein
MIEICEMIHAVTSGNQGKNEEGIEKRASAGA